MALLSKGNSLDSPVEVGQPVFAAPFPADPKPYVYSLPMKVRAGHYTPLALDTAGLTDYYHTGENNFTQEQGLIMAYLRWFAQVPDTRSEYESFVYAYQRIFIGGDAPSIETIPITVNSRVQYDYFHTTDPAGDITLAQGVRAFLSGGSVGFFGIDLAGWLALETGDEILAEDSTYKQWRGNIYERQQRFVTFVKLADLL